MEKQTNSFELLLNDKIIDILLGNTEFGWSEHDDFFVMYMPKLSFEELEKISTSFGLEKNILQSITI